MSDVIKSFRDVAAADGVELPEHVEADGELHRFTVNGDRAKSKNGWFVLYLDDPAAGAYGDWKRGISGSWCSKAQDSLSPVEKFQLRAKMEAAARQKEIERARIHSECVEWCTTVWGNAKSATNRHPYLQRKGVNSYGLRTYGKALLIPVEDMDGEIHGLQFISPDGAKKFKTGTDKTGHFYGIGEAKGNTLLIAEGYATAASVHQATGYPTLVAFDAGNLKPVAESVKKRFPHLKIIICADNDQWTPGNPGLTKASEAARAVGGLLAVPIFEGGLYGKAN